MTTYTLSIMCARIIQTGNHSPKKYLLVIIAFPLPPSATFPSPIPNKSPPNIRCIPPLPSVIDRYTETNINLLTRKLDVNASARCSTSGLFYHIPARYHHETPHSFCTLEVGRIRANLKLCFRKTYIFHWDGLRGVHGRLLGALMVCHRHRMVLWHAGVFHALRTQTEILYQSSRALVATIIDHIRRSTLLTLYINNAVCKAVVPVVRGSLHWLFKQFLVAYFLILLLTLIREFVFLM